MQNLLKSLIDPRGRCNRKGLLIAAFVLLATELVAALAVWVADLSLDHPGLMAAKAGMLWIAIAASSQRLHDLGRSAWHIVWGFLALFAWSFAAAIFASIYLGPDNILPGTSGFWLVFAAVAAPMLAALMWLHFAPGEPKANRFGPVPAGPGFARHENRARHAPQDALPV
jgi:uncharacterized membrane protein YhaH (DUF805 family)